VRAYIIRRLLLMIPTLFGVTLVTFIVMQFAPGDPLKKELSPTGSQGESGATREAYLHQKKQWKLDKPAMLNVRWFRNYDGPARHCATIYGLPDHEIRTRLDQMADSDQHRDLHRFLQELKIDSFEDQLKNPERRAELLPRVKTGVQIHVEETISEHGVMAFTALLDDSDLAIRIGAIRCLSLCTLGDPFVYTYSKEPQPDETDGVVTTWSIWWNRDKSKFSALPPERLKIVQDSFKSLADEPSRAKILEGVAVFQKSDAPFLMEKLSGDTSIKEKSVASISLKAAVGRPLKVDVKLSDKQPEVKAVAENWRGYDALHNGRYDPSIAARVLYFFLDTQYANSLAKLITFSFGRSMVKPYDPVGPEILRAAKVSAPLMLLAEAVVYLLAVPLGVFAAVRRGNWQDRSISLGLFVLYSIPPVVLGMLFLTFFAFGAFLKWFPMYGLHAENAETLSSLRYGLDYLWHISGPMLCLTLTQMASLAMFGRSSMLDVVNQDYIRTARAKGLPGRSVILRHALRNAMIPIITLFSNFIPALLGGSVIVEYLFGIPGMGRLSYDSIQNKDYNTVMALIYLDAIIVMFSILLSDFLYVVVDPRISFSKSEGQG
jgi:peptide/nickel transport system permease protein